MTRAIAKVVAVLSIVPLVQVGVPAAATNTSAASSSEALRGRVVIDCQGTRRTTFPPPPARGRCTVSGAITDRGKFVDDAILRVHPHGRTVFGAKGTIVFSVYGERGHWRIIDGTRAYAGLRGRGWESPARNWESTGPCPVGCPFDFTMTGTVSQ
jgi:hypothetical protein